jgi:integrase
MIGLEMPYSKHLPKILTDDDITLIVQTIFDSNNYSTNQIGEFLKWRDATYIEFLFYTGLRPIEGLQLRWDDIDLEKNLIYVRPYENHKRKNDLPAILTTPARKILSKYQNEFLKCPIKSEFIFPSIPLGKPMATCTMERRFLDICKHAGLAKIEYNRPSDGKPRYSISLYCLRHSFCTKIYKKTGSEIAVARLARHTQVQSASIYTHLNFEDKKHIADFVFNE